MLALITAREKMTINDTRNDTGNGKRNDMIITATKEISIQGRLLFWTGLSLPFLIPIFLDNYI
jgi:hypothetical protein